VTVGNSADEIVAKVVAALDQRGDSAKAAEAGLEQKTIFQLARRIRPEVIGFEQAVKELENAIGIALGVIAKGERGSNQEAFVEDVLKRLAETTKKGDFDGGAKAVDEALAELDRRDAERRDAFRGSRETLLEAGIEQDLLRRDPVAVARRIEAMDATDGDPFWSQKYKERWDAFYAEGDEKGINLSLEVAIEMARRMAASARDGDQRATALNMFGAALQALGARESATARLTEAVAAYREALQERTRARVPLDWAMIQMNLGNSLKSLGERESGTEGLTEAVVAFREALQEFTRERVPLDWARTQMNLGNALAGLGERESGTARLEEAIAAFQEALQERTRERVPLKWARTQMNLGNALRILGERKSGTARLEESVSACREALRENTRERVPLEWARTQNNLGTALRVLGERESGTARLEDAVSAHRAALEERTRERVPLHWAATQNNLGRCAGSARRAGERDGAAHGGRRRLSRGLAGNYPRARAARLGQDPDESRQCARRTRRAGERDGAYQGGCRRLSRSLAGKHPRARAARLGQNPDESRPCAF
jgi:tetratricopeptide (TPR) repeat protein